MNSNIEDSGQRPIKITGEQVQIIKKLPNGECALDEKKLEAILNNETIANKPIVVVSIGGKLREGIHVFILLINTKHKPFYRIFLQ